jgi:SAM-dependent methyltransferase
MGIETGTTGGGQLDDERFEFGKNWQSFLSVLDEGRITHAQTALAEMLDHDVSGHTFLDIGSGSGLSSLVAARLGAARLHSFDYDQASVAATAELRRRFGPPGVAWTVEPGDALDRDYMRGLGTFEIVYSWGVLHHTGSMWTGIANACDAVVPGGRLFLAIYNDQGRTTRIWRRVKLTYIALPEALKRPFVIAVGLVYGAWNFVNSLSLREPSAPLRSLKPDPYRGMDPWHDLVDWIGGYPFEVATPDEIFSFCHARGFDLIRMRTVGAGLGCNEFVFRRHAP